MTELDQKTYGKYSRHRRNVETEEATTDACETPYNVGVRSDVRIVLHINDSISSRFKCINVIEHLHLSPF